MRTEEEPVDGPSLPSFGANYRVIRRVKRGGMAEIFEGCRIGPDGFERKVALKLPLALDGKKDRAAFADEARILSQLNHPGIVSVFDFAEHEGAPFQVLEYVDGLDLSLLYTRAREASRPIQPVHALYIAMRIAEALEHAHRACDFRGRPLRIVHRDVSPQNILVSWTGDVKLTDFGIAFAEDRLARTQKGFVKGKLSFMAPEQLRGEPVSPATDLFGLGCVLAFMLTGDSPIGEWRRRMATFEGEELPIDERLPADVCEIVERATRARVRDRHASAEKMARACRSALLRHGVNARDELRSWLTAIAGPPAPRTPFAELFEIRDRPLTEAPSTVREESPARPLRCGRFELVGVLGPAGAGELFLARCEELADCVIKKVSQSKLSGAQSAALFFTEAAMFSQLEHDNLLRVIEFGVDGDDWFLALAHPSGRTLREALDRADGGFSALETAAIAADLCDGLAFARALPGNRAFPSIQRKLACETVLLTEEGRAVIADYGVCTSAERIATDARSLDEVRDLAGVLWLLGRFEGELESIVAQLYREGDAADLTLASHRFRSYLESCSAVPSRVLGDLVARCFGSSEADERSTFLECSRTRRTPSTSSARIKRAVVGAIIVLAAVGAGVAWSLLQTT